MANHSLTPIWSPADAREVFERAATVKAAEAVRDTAQVINLGEVLPR